MSKLTEPIKTGSKTLSLRLAMAPAAQERADDGKITQDILNYYDERTKGGCFGLVIVEHSYIRRDGRAGLRQISVSSDDDIEGLSRLSDVIHANGSMAIVQINHAGASAKKSVVSGVSISPSGLHNPISRVDKSELQETRAMTAEEIGELVTAYADAAERVKRAGFDGVEIHSAHGYMLNQFFSPMVNKRTDEYAGNSIDGRIRIHIQVINAVRERVGSDFIVGLRLGGCDYTDGGSTIQDAAEAAAKLEKAGIDFIDVTGGMCSYMRNGHTEPGYFGDLGRAVKASVSIPVILAGGIKTMADAEMFIESGMADIAAVGRAIIADAAWARHGAAR